jgi:hypothetical protein
MKPNKDNIILMRLAPKERPKNFRDWMGLYAVNEDTKETYFFPQMIGYSRMEALICAGYDGTPVVVTTFKGKQYSFYSYTWLKKEVEKQIKRIERKLKQLVMPIMDAEKRKNLESLLAFAKNQSRVLDVAREKALKSFEEAEGAKNETND